MIAKTRRAMLLAKADADRIFGFTKSQWDSTARTCIPHGWDVKFAKHDTGVHVVGFDPNTGLGFSLQPLYENDIDSPKMIIVGNYFPSGHSPRVTPEVTSEMEANAGNTLAPMYKVKTNTTSITMSGATYDVIEFMVTKREIGGSETVRS